MTTEFESHIPLTVQPGGVNSTLIGINYQVKLVLLAITKTYKNSNLDFNVSTEIKETEPFDDVILNVENRAVRFVQCKSKETPITLSFKDFFDRTKKNFYLPKYFDGYVNIMKNFKKIQDFVICTNNSIPACLSLLDTTGVRTTTDEISFQKITGSDEVFGNFSERFKIDQKCKATIRTRLIQHLRTQGATQEVDNYLDGFLSDLLLVFDLKAEDIEKEIDEFIQNHFNLSVVDCQKSTLMWTLYSWIEGMKTVKTINREKFLKYLMETKEKSQIIPKLIDRSENLFASSKFQYKIRAELTDFIGKIKNGSNQLFYMQVKEDDTFYGSCMVKEELKAKTSDEFLFLSTDFLSSHIGDGLKIFPMQNCFDFLIFVENKNNSMQNYYKDQIKDILSKNCKKRAMIITDQVKSKFAADIIGADENFLAIPKVKLSDLSQESLDVFLEEKKLKLQNELVKLGSVLDSSDQSLFNLKDFEVIESIGGNVIAGKNFDPDLYIERNLFHRNVIKKTIEKNKKSDQIIASEKSSFDTFCNQFPAASVHLLESQSNQKDLVWKMSQGYIDYLFSYVDAEQGTEIQNPWETQATSHKTFIVIDVPGMGKTFWMNHLAQKLKSKQKNYFTVNISFNDYTEYFEDHKFEDEESVLKFMECEVLKLQNDTEKQIFRSACTKTGKVFVVLDGLDEVCPDSEIEMFNLIELLRQMPISGLFVSTRPELRKQLEEKMQNFCHEFVPFSKENQINFLEKFWSKNMHEKLTDDDLRAVSKKVVLLIEEKELTEIAGIPLITRMVAEIFETDLILKAIKDDDIVKDTIYNISHLYEKFVDKKIERYLVEKLNQDLSKRANRRKAEQDKQKLVTLYKKMALKLILPWYVNLFYENFELTSDDLEEMRKCGLVLSDSETKFMHRTIAEYFVALAILEKFHDQRVAELVIQEIFCDEKFNVIRSFLLF